VLNRFKTSLFQPSNIARFRRDTALTTILYYLLLVILATIPSIILIFSTVGLNYQTKSTIRNEVRNLEIPYEIKDYELVKNPDIEETYHRYELKNNIIVVFTDLDFSEVEYNGIYVGSLIIFTKDKVVYEELLFERIIVEYDEYPSLRNLDFSKTKDLEFWDTVFPIVNDLMEEHNQKFRYINTIAVFTVTIISLLLFSLLIAVFLRSRLANIINFSKTWQLTIYAMTPYIIFTLFGELYNFGFLSLIGLVISYMHANKMSLSIIKN
jgi:uncharacterized membrane protein YesL